MAHAVRTAAVDYGPVRRPPTVAAAVPDGGHAVRLRRAPLEGIGDRIGA